MSPSAAAGGASEARFPQHRGFSERLTALASLRSLVRTEPDRAEATIDALVAHLRATLPKFRAGTEEAESTLGQQLEVCRSYLEVMHVRIELAWFESVPITPGRRLVFSWLAEPTRGE